MEIAFKMKLYAFFVIFKFAFNEANKTFFLEEESPTLNLLHKDIYS